MISARPAELLRTIPPFAALSDEVRGVVLAHCTEVRHRAGVRIITAGERPAALSIVVSGQVRVLDTRDEQNAVTIDVLGSGALLGQPLLDRAPAAFSVETIAETELLQLSAGSLEQLIDAEREFAAALGDHAAARAHVTEPARASSTGGAATPHAVESTAPVTGHHAASGGTAITREDAGAVSLQATIRPFRRYLRPLYPLLGELLAASIVMQVLALLLPVLARFIVDDVVARADGRWLESALAGIASVLVLYFLANASRRYLGDFISRQVDARLVADVYKHLVRLPMRFFEARHAGDLVAMFDDLGHVTDFVTRTGVGFLIDLVTAALYVGLMIHYSGWLTAVAVAFVAAQVATLYFVTPHLQRGFDAMARQENDTESLLIEALAGLKTIKMLAMEPFIRWRLHDKLARVTNTALATMRYRTVARVATDIVTGAGMLAIFILGARLVLAGRLTLGELVAFAILTHGLTTPFAQFVTIWDTLQDTARSARNVTEVLTHPPETSAQPLPDQIVLRKLQGHLRFDGVSFRYSEATPYVLRNVSCECYGGQRVAILGRSGSGKSTLVKLLLGLHAPTAGDISVDGTPLAEIWLPALRRQTGAVLQDTALFRGSIRANISHTMPAAPMGEVIAAATLSNAHRFISALPEGYNTELAGNGANLSGGQRQQVAIARALLHRPAVIVFDEATSNVDGESSRLLQQNLDMAFKDSTILMVTQRLDIARHADLILVLDRGTLAEQGTHDELLAAGGLYTQLTRAQAV